jgi:hypothetical protein
MSNPTPSRAASAESRTPVEIEATATDITPPPAEPARREEFDVLKLSPTRYDKWDRLYRNVVLILFAIAVVAGLYYRR